MIQLFRRNKTVFLVENLCVTPQQSDVAYVYWYKALYQYHCDIQIGGFYSFCFCIVSITIIVEDKPSAVQGKKIR
ncbi:hypothetical protein RRG08_062520 [Elysia crispata]|uniref:Uncharacterized protein n=1 Tax=Elysia crispata TaxID=231223 RepID=A0AAE1E1J4_9GAST|nr:hypothetical protein RRG08_062520 [Elysia crispata]